MSSLIQATRFYLGKAPVADCYAAGSTPVIDIRKCERVLFVAQMGVAGGADRITFTVDACNNVTPSLTAQCDIWYRLGNGAASDLGESMADVVHQDTPATGSTQILAADCAGTLHLIEVEAAECKRRGRLAATAFDAVGVRLTWATSAAGGIVGSVLAIMTGVRYQSDKLVAGLYA